MDSLSQSNRIFTDSAPSQIIASQRIDPAKLSFLLKKKFGEEAYRVEMRHNMFSIFASGSLSQEDIDRCSYGPYGSAQMH
ncbi:hypothetical protein LZ32DRAFT_599580 [Colletotrichum eremochloae]|nr:hypothetical protein LZ32DRAFT_599580 [Colletotrichum eremochloae]